MINEMAFLVLLVGYGLLFSWAFRTLPQEGWQILASLPWRKRDRTTWVGFNLTYYGLLNATAVMLSVAVVIVLLGSLSVPGHMIVALIVTLLALTVPTAKGLARIIEKKQNTFTIGGASIFGLLAAPWVIILLNLLNAGLGNRQSVELPMFGSLAAIVVAYAFGEGTGRLACISFGCCYGKPLAATRPWLASVFRAWHFSFTGSTKKAVYEGGLKDVPVIPIQAVTAVIHVCSGLLGLWLFLSGSFQHAFLITVLITQLWRVFSELLRADCRGEGTFSWYQIMALSGILYALLLPALISIAPSAKPDLLTGIRTLWYPSMILILQLIWLVIFFYTGFSKVTGSTMSFHVVKDSI